MRAVVQRVSKASVTVDQKCCASIGQGLLVLLAAGQGDGLPSVDWMAEKIVHLRCFSDSAGRMNRSLLDVGGQMIAVSQFTLYGDCRKGRRPSFIRALQPEAASVLIDRFVERVVGFGVQCGTGIFGADMAVELVNDGPVTLLLDTDQTVSKV